MRGMCTCAVVPSISQTSPIEVLCTRLHARRRQHSKHLNPYTAHLHAVEDNDPSIGQNDGIPADTPEDLGRAVGHEGFHVLDLPTAGRYDGQTRKNLKHAALQLYRRQGPSCRDSLVVLLLCPSPPCVTPVHRNNDATPLRHKCWPRPVEQGSMQGPQVLRQAQSQPEERHWWRLWLHMLNDSHTSAQ